MSKYAPAREDGKKPYVVESRQIGRRSYWISYTKTPNDAKHAGGRMSHLESRSVRRATHEDMESYRYDGMS